MKHLPDDINAELLLTHDCGMRLQVRHTSTHQRNAMGDVAALEHDIHDPHAATLLLSRASLYDALPEYMFHTVDRFSNLDESRDENAFANEVDRQKQELEHALQFFAPFDALLLLLRTDTRQRIEQHTRHGNTVLQNIIGDRLTDEQRDNRFIAALLPFLPACHRIRGNRTLLTLMLRKVLADEGLTLRVDQRTLTHHDPEPRYHYCMGDKLDECFAGNDFDYTATVFTIHYWSDDLCDEHFLDTIDQLEHMRQFVQDWFMGLEQQLVFDIWTDDTPSVRLDDTECHNYLDYNTNL